jgi:hypothetical protein
VYTDAESEQYLPPIPSGAFVKIVILPLTELYNYRYKDYWITNHKNNHLLNNRSGWELNMLWAEKISFVQRTIDENPYGTEFFGWCDIGYFRDNATLFGWPFDEVIDNLDTNKIHYGQIHYDPNIQNIVCHKNENGLPNVPIPMDQVSFAGGFFILHYSKIEWWKETFDEKLHSYFIHGYLVKDDQIIITDCIYSDPEEFQIYTEDIPGMDNWFMFRRILQNF